MMLFRFVLLVVFALTTVALFYPSSSSSTDKIRLSDVEVLTFYKDSYTTGRRTSARRQIECRSGCNNYFPEELQCYNRKYRVIDSSYLG